MICYLVRHGIAEERSPERADGERALTAEGIRKMRQAVDGLHRLDVKPGAIWSSPLCRAQETASLLTTGLGIKSSAICAALAPEGDQAALLTAMQTAPAPLMLVGHQPDLGMLASRLLTGDADGVFLPFKKGGVACITWNGHEPAGHGQLEWFLTPAQLRFIGRA
ncbi:MAG: phosphohistidine phosphatase SixA [Candidatus Macondimonas sp.]|jgi:phosphohistidine phosphatase